jgi:hypothetical protein
VRHVHDADNASLEGRPMLDPVELYKLFHKQPFQPTRVFVKDGRIFDIPHERMAVVGDTYFAIGVPAYNEPYPICAFLVNVPLKDIERVEHIPVTALIRRP